MHCHWAGSGLVTGLVGFFSTGFNYFWGYNQGFPSIRRSPHTDPFVLYSPATSTLSLRRHAYNLAVIYLFFLPWSILHSSVMSLDFTHVLVSCFPFLLFYPSPGGLLQPTGKRFSSSANSLDFGSHCFGLGKDPDCSVFPVLFSAFSHCYTRGCLCVLEVLRRERFCLTTDYEQRRDSATHVHESILLQIFFPSRLCGSLLSMVV